MTRYYLQRAGLQLVAAATMIVLVGLFGAPAAVSGMGLAVIWIGGVYADAFCKGGTS